MNLSKFDLTGKVALITGASHGIGFAIAEALAKAGATVCFNCSSQRSLEKGMATYQAAGIDAHGYVCDVTDETAVNEMVTRIAQEVGTVDILVNNAGISERTPFTQYTEEVYDKVMDLNVKGVFTAARVAAEYMEKQGGGVILTTSPMVSIYGQPAGFAYPASKFAVNGLTVSLARELGPKGIRVNAVAPGITETDMMKAVPKEVIEPMIARIPLRRLGQPEDIANAFVFLASDEASYITGVVLSVDGMARS